MKLVRIFSNKNFTNIKFNDGFNVVLATIQDVANKRDTHNLGKTSLLRVIDFLLLCRSPKKGDLLSNSFFKGQIFYLEIKLNNGEYLIIKRAIDSPTKISFKINDVSLADFSVPDIWDFENMAYDKAKDKLNEYLGFDVVSNWPYRKSVTYFLRTQQDYLDVFQLGKFKGDHSDWKPFVFELLGFDGNLIAKKYELDQLIEDKKNAIKSIKQEANVNPEEKDRILGLIDIKNQEKISAEQSIDKFNFYAHDRNITKDVIENIDAQIQILNTERYRLNYELQKAENALRQSVSEINLQKLQELYDDTNLFFPNELKKKYSELEAFNYAISVERKKYISENLKKLQSEYNEIDNQIKALEADKTDKLAFLIETDSYTKFKQYQKQLSEVESDLKMLNVKLQLIDRTIEINENIKEIDRDLVQAKDDINNAINLQKHADIRRIFNQIITEVVGTNAIISLKQNQKGNVDYSADYQNLQQATTSEANGTSYKKLLCAAFDLTLLIHYSQKSFFKFVYHDGILEGLDDRIKVRLLDYVKSVCQQYGIQYIVSSIDSDIPRMLDGTIYPIQSSEICLQLNDRNDEGKLFKHSF
ncbi:MAG: DUF2326 domain-containing protein [Bacteroidales bacterium]|nr:DUF2326 domain-containing protein [Bacteroidales bacterium]